MSEPQSENNSPAEKRTAAPMPVRRARPGGVPGSASAAGTRAAAPPDTAKSIALVVCGLLFAGIVGLGGYKLLHKATVKPVALAPEAQALADKAVRAKALYNEGKELAGSANLEELRVAEKKLTEANQLFNEIYDSNATVKGFEEEIKNAEEKRLSIDKLLAPLRFKIDKLDTEASASSRPKTAPVPTPVPATPATDPNPATQPTEAQLFDANLDRLFKDDPSEYERLAKIRKAKDPAYVIKKEE